MIDVVYATASEPAKQEAMLHTLNDFLGGQLLLVDVREAGSGRLLKSEAKTRSTGLLSAHDEYVAKWHDCDPRAELLSSLGPGAVMRCDQHFREEFVQTNAFYQQFLLRHGLRWSIGGMYDNDDGTVTLITSTRASHDEPFGAASAAALRELLRHLKRASALRSKIQPPSPSALAGVQLFNLLPMPLLLTDSAGRCIESNEAFVEAAQWLGLRPVFGRLRMTDPEQQLSWERALAETLGTAVERSVLLSANGRHWRVRLLPRAAQLPGSTHETHLILAVFEQKTAVAAPAPAFAANARFTRAELEVLAGLMQGLSAKAIANQRGASVNTVRSQITSILEKSGHSSQRELIAAFGASAFQDSRSGDSVSPYA